MNFPWQNPLPFDEYATTKVVVYFYSGQWVPIMFYKLVDAIALHRKAKQQGKELFIFPSHVKPKDMQDD